MSWAGKKSLRDSFRSLFSKKEQAPSFPVESPAPAAVRLPAKTMRHLDSLIQKWIEGKGYRMPDKTIEEAAHRIGTDSLTLFRYFKALGQDFRSFRTRLRIEDAKQQLLEEPNTPASTIALRVGFKDRSNFSQQFKRYTGLTPDTWRKTQA